jgi:hypothetical protein
LYSAAISLAHSALSCLKALRADDVLVVWRLDRLGRSLSELVRIAGQLEHRKIGLESIMEKIETVSSAGKLVFHVFAALAEFGANSSTGYLFPMTDSQCGDAATFKTATRDSETAMWTH